MGEKQTNRRTDEPRHFRENPAADAVAFHKKQDFLLPEEPTGLNPYHCSP